MWGKPYVTNVEREFKTDKMRDRHVFHDVNLRVNDPEDFRVTSVEYLRSLGYIVDVNEMTEFEQDDEFSKFFRGGRLKPLKNVIKARHSSYLGSRFPTVWKLLLLVGITSLISYFLPFEELNKDFLFYTFTISLIFAGLFYLIKKVVVSSVWVKMVGVYDAESVKADVRLIISADISESESKVFDKLRDDVAEFYNLVSHRYLRKPVKEDSLVKSVTKSKTEELVTKIMKVNKNMEVLRDKFINGRVSEDVFKRLISSLEKDKDKIETVLDLVSL